MTAIPATAQAPTFSPGVFPLGYVFQRGDLPIYLSDMAGTSIDPATITFTIFRYEPGNPNPIQAGASERIPVHHTVGEFYATGVSGECGQPGDWFVRWRYQELPDSPLIEDIFPFKVFDTAKYAPGGCDSKYGWG